MGANNGKQYGSEGKGSSSISSDVSSSTDHTPTKAQKNAATSEVRAPKLNTALEVRPHQSQVKGHNHFPGTSQDAVGLFGPLGTLLAHVQPVVSQHPQVLFCQAAFQPLFPKPVVFHGVVVTDMQDLALGLVEPDTVGLGPLIHPVQISLQSLPTLKQINTPAQFGVICKLTEGALNPLVQIINKGLKQDWPQNYALGNTTRDQPPTGFNSVHHNSLGSAFQPVFYPAKSAPV
ncbi:mitochondrial enolase superfamily member 1 [Grus japonensis]|uniref:Mitochondrial enolase superfamily member 1 n=1 Tax=Grus japonensis TaxID=30415 RepID=A0ABC9WE30_GRUJA